jgi:Ca-activated chloride channel homolog
MDQRTQGFDPNRTIIGSPMDARTQAMSGPPSAGLPGDPNRTVAMAPPVSGLQFSITPSRAAAMANGPAREQFLIDIQAPSVPGLSGFYGQETRTAVNVCLVVDRSGSMEGMPIEYAKQACQQVVDLLSPTDILSIVVFDEVVEVLMPPQRVTNRDAVKAGISQLQPGYTTNISDGMNLAAQQILSVLDPARVNRMVVLSDGEPTAGIKDFSALVQLAGDIKTRGISCTFLGFGQDYNEELLASMAKRAGGNYYYIAQPQQIPQIFKEEMSAIMSTTMTGAKLGLKLSRWVELVGITGQQGVAGQKEVEFELADLEKGSGIQLVVDLEFPNHPLGHYRVLTGRLSYMDPLTGKSETKDLDFIMEFTSDVSRYSAPVNPAVAAAHQASVASRAVEKTLFGLKTQAITVAAALMDLQKTQALLAGQGRIGEAKEVTLAMQAIQRGDKGGAEKTLMGAVVQLDQGKSKR